MWKLTVSQMSAKNSIQGLAKILLSDAKQNHHSLKVGTQIIAPLLCHVLLAQ